MKVIKYIVCLALVVGFVGVGVNAMTQDLDDTKRPALMFVAPYVADGLASKIDKWAENGTMVELVFKGLGEHGHEKMLVGKIKSREPGVLYFIREGWKVDEVVFINALQIIRAAKVPEG